MKMQMSSPAHHKREYRRIELLMLVGIVDRKRKGMTNAPLRRRVHIECRHRRERVLGVRLGHG
jgi:hypothetical protein